MGVDSSDRIGRFGVPCLLLFQGGQRCVVQTQKQTKRNQWAKVREREGTSICRAEIEWGWRSSVACLLALALWGDSSIDSLRLAQKGVK